jgi:F0F1-type ATP synthase gamma subunit
MLNKKSLQSEMAVLLSMQEIVGAYEEIAAMRMRKVKKSVLQNRDFLSGLNNLYNRVWYTYLHERRVNSLGFPVKRPESVFVGNGKTVSVLVSANTRLYGDIIKKTFDLFLKSIKDTETDIVVIG